MTPRARALRPLVAAFLVAGGAAAARAQADPGAPAWITPGMRITFYAASATTGVGDILVPDDEAMEHEKQRAQKRANETGETQYYTYWKDSHGQQYSINEGGGMSGQSYVEVNVAAVDRGTAAVEARLYGIDVATGTVRAPSAAGQVVVASTGGDYWMHPALLRQMAAAPAVRGVSVKRVPCELRGRTYQALQLRVQNESGFIQRIYDLATGVLLRMSSATSSAASAWVPDAGGTSHLGGGRTTLTEAWLVGTRQLKLPWLGLPAPEWVPRTHTLRYAGTQGAFVPGTGPMGFPLLVLISVRRTGASWMEFTESDQVTSPYGMPPQQSEAGRVAGTNQLGGLWIPPAALARLQPGQQLDRDPVTHVQVAVAGVDADRVTLQEAGTEYRTQYVYARDTGMLVATAQQQQVGAATAQMSVTLQGRD